MSGPLNKAKIETVRKRKEENLRRFATVVRDSNDALIISDFEGRITAWNRGAELMYGYSEEDALQMTLWQITPSSKAAEKKEFIRRLKEGEAITSFETQRKTKDGRVLDVWMTVTKLVNDAGKPVGIASTERDITGRKKKEEEVSRMVTVVRDSNDAITIQDFDGRITAWNRGAELMYGYSEEEALQKNIWLLTPPNRKEEQKDFTRRLIAGEKITSLETQRVTKDGRILDVWMTVTKLVDDAGKPIGIASTERDITTRKRAEEALQASDALLQAAINILPVGLWIIDAEGKIVTSSAAAQRIWAGVHYVGIDQLGEYKGWRTDSGKLIEAHEWAGARALEKGETSIEEEVEIECFDGTHKIILDSAVPLLKSDGSIGGAITINQDITERKRAEAALGESEAKYRNLVENASIGIFRTKIDGSRVLDANPKLCEILGLTREEFVGQPSAIAWAYPEQRAKLVRLLREKGNVSNYEIDIRTKSGEIRTVLMSMTTHPELGYIEGGLQDITERKRLEEKLLQYNVRLEQKSRDQEQIVYAASHDLRTPLVNVQGFGKELARSVQEITEAIKAENISLETKNKIEPILKKDIPESLSFIQSGITQMDMQLSALLKLSRLGRAAISVEKLDMNTIVCEVAKSLEYMVKEKGAEIVVSELPSCMADAAQMNQIFLNLIENALKYLDAKRPGVIHISGSSHEREVIYCVEDNGAGIAQEYQEKIFEIFYRVEHGKHLGEGLGLTIVRQCAEKQNGSVWVESEPGKGSRFFVKLPGA